MANTPRTILFFAVAASSTSGWTPRDVARELAEALRRHVLVEGASIIEPDGQRFIPTEALREGDQIDLSSCPFLFEHASAEFEYAVVADVERETPDCVRVAFEGIDHVGYPAGTQLLVKRNEPELPQLLGRLIAESRAKRGAAADGLQEAEANGRADALREVAIALNVEPEAMPPELAAEGYRLEVGDDADDDELRGGFWWTLSRPGWMECETCEGHFSTTDAAIADARRHCDEEQARGANAFKPW